MRRERLLRGRLGLTMEQFRSRNGRTDAGCDGGLSGSFHETGFGPTPGNFAGESAWYIRQYHPAVRWLFSDHTANRFKPGCPPLKAFAILNQPGHYLNFFVIDAA